MRFNDLLHLVAFPGRAHGTPPTPGFVTATKMPESRAFSKCSAHFSPYIPLSPPPPRADDGGLVEVSQMLARHTERQAAGRGRWLGITRAAGGRGSPSLPWEARPIPCQMMEYPQCRRP